MQPTTPTDIDRRTVLKTAGASVAALAAGGIGLTALTGGAAASAQLGVSIDDAAIANDAGHLNYVGVDASKTISWAGFDVPVAYIGFKHEITLVNATADTTTDWHRLYPAPGAADDPDGDGFAVSAKLPDWSNYGDDEAVTSYTTDAADYPDGTTGEAVAGVVWEIINDTGDPGSYPGFGYDGGAGPQDPAQWADILSATGDGEVNATDVRWRTTLRFYEEANGPAQITGDDGVPEVVGEDTFTVTVTNQSGETAGSTSGGSSTAG